MKQITQFFLKDESPTLNTYLAMPHKRFAEKFLLQVTSHSHFF